MPTRDVAPLGAPCWIELMTSDADRSRAFYGELFGWTSESGGEDFGGYTTFDKDGSRVAGCMPKQEGMDLADGWSVYLATADAEAVAAAATAHGGTVLHEAMDVMELGRMAFVVDPGGASIGAWQPGTHPGFGLLAEPGAPAWFELHTREHAASVAFYEGVFGWHTKSMGDTDEFRYTTLGEDEDALAGVMDASSWLPEGTPGEWYIYFGVADADATATKLVELGGAMVDGPEDTPYGRLATATDPTGATFKFMQG